MPITTLCIYKGGPSDGGAGFACDASLLSDPFFAPAGLVIVIPADPSSFFYSIISVRYLYLRIRSLISSSVHLHNYLLLLSFLV